MNKHLKQNLVWIGILLVVAVVAYVLIGNRSSTMPHGQAVAPIDASDRTNPDAITKKDTIPTKVATTKTVTKIPSTPEGRDVKNATYIINGNAVKLSNGVSSSGMTRYIGFESMGDLNGDIIQDTALIISQNLGGSGTFYYVVAAIKTNNGYKGTNGVLIGDRIIPNRTDIGGGDVVVSYTDRKPGEPMTAVPSVGKSKQYYLKNGTLITR